MRKHPILKMSSTPLKDQYKPPHDILLYFLLAFVFSWALALPIGLTNKGYLISGISDNWHPLVSLGPAIAAIILISIRYGKLGFQTLGKSLVSIKTCSKYVFFILFAPIWMFAIAFCIALIFTPLSTMISHFQTSSIIQNRTWFINFLIIPLCFGIFEEIGWRGYALPRLQAKNYASKAVWVLGLAWAFWHIPFFLYRFEFTWIGFFGYVVSIIMGTGLLAILYNSSDGSLLAVIIWHILFDIANIFAQELAGEISMIISIEVIVVAIFLVRKTGAESFSFSQKVTLP